MLHFQRTPGRRTVCGFGAMLLVAPMIAGCGSDGATGPAGTGYLSVGLAAASDAGVSGLLVLAGPEESATVYELRLTFDVIRVFPAGSDTASCGWGPESEGLDGTECPYISVLTAPVTVDALGGESLAAVLGEMELPAGRYSHLAVRVTDAVAVLNHGTQVTVQVPGATSRLRVLAPFTVVAGEQTDVTLVIDVAQSLLETPDAQLVLRPVVHAEVRGGVSRDS